MLLSASRIVNSMHVELMLFSVSAVVSVISFLFVVEKKVTASDGSSHLHFLSRKVTHSLLQRW